MFELSFSLNLSVAMYIPHVKPGTRGYRFSAKVYWLMNADSISLVLFLGVKKGKLPVGKMSVIRGRDHIPNTFLYPASH